MIGPLVARFSAAGPLVVRLDEDLWREVQFNVQVVEEAIVKRGLLRKLYHIDFNAEEPFFIRLQAIVPHEESLLLTLVKVGPSH